MKRKLIVELELENDAFRDEMGAMEASRILVGLAASLELDGFIDAGTETPYGAASGLWDHNGNWTGSWRVILDDRLDHEPMRWAHLSPGEFEALRTAVHNRIYTLSEYGRQLDPNEHSERQYLENLNRELNIEKGRRLGE